MNYSVISSPSQSVSSRCRERHPFHNLFRPELTRRSCDQEGNGSQDKSRSVGRLYQSYNLFKYMHIPSHMPLLYSRYDTYILCGLPPNVSTVEPLWEQIEI